MSKKEQHSFHLKHATKSDKKQTTANLYILSKTGGCSKQVFVIPVRILTTIFSFYKNYM